MKSLSVIICTWNRAVLLGSTLDSLQTLELPPGIDVEFLVVDNNSADGTAEAVRQRISGWRPGKLRYILEVRQGKQFALNTGIANATGEVLAFTDDDVAIRTDWLKVIHRLFSDPSLDLAGGKTGIVWPNGKPPLWFNKSMLAVVAGVDLGDAPLSPPPAHYAPAGTNLIARHALFGRIGGFSEKLFRHMDYDLGMRATSCGSRIAYSPSLVVKTEVPDIAVNRRYFRHWYFKLGIAMALRLDGSGRRLLWVPLSVWSEAARGLLGWLFSRFHPDAAHRFEMELNCWKLAGNILERWHSRLFPKTHAQWVYRWSQKKDEIFG